MSIYLDIPMKPTPKGRPRMTRSGHTYTPEATKLAEGVIRAYAERLDTVYDGCALWVEILFTFKKPKSNKTTMHTQRPDIDNCAKLVTDALNGLAYKDDAQIVLLRASKEWGDHDRVEVWIEPARPR